MINGETEPAIGADPRAVKFNTAMMVCMFAIVAMAYAAFIGVSGVAGAISSGTVTDQPQAYALSTLLSEHDRRINEFAQRFDSRAVFFAPPRKMKSEASNAEPRPLPEPEPIIIAGPPDRYSGPNIAWVVGDDVYFAKTPASKTEKYFHLQAGDERDGVKVLSTAALPKTVRVAHAGGEYDVPVFGVKADAESLFDVAEVTTSDPDGYVPQGVSR